MEASFWRSVSHNISSFFCLSSCDNISSEPVWTNYQKIGEILKLLKPIVDLVVDANVAYDEHFSKALNQLVLTIKECRSLFENWHPLASRIHLVLQAEPLTTRIWASTMEILLLLKDLHQYLPAELSLASLEKSIENVKNMGCESTTSTKISKALNDQACSLGPTPESLEEVAGSLGLRSNQDILIEGAALEKWRESVAQTEKDTDMNKIEQLISLITHMHDHLVMLKQSESHTPGGFCCPLSLELMSDPVIIASGQTYDRAHIKKWLVLGLTVCPKTRLKLHHTFMITNHTAKALIANWCETNNLKMPGNEHKKLVDGLKSDSIEDLRKATAEILLFLKKNIDNRVVVAVYGGIRLLVKLLSSSDSKTQENAVTALLYLAANNDNKITLTNEHPIKPLIHVLQTGTPVAQENSAATLFCLSMIHENKSRMGSLGAISPLVVLLRNGTPRGKNNAVIALFNLSIAHENRVRIVHAGAVRHLVQLINDPVAGLLDKVVMVLESLSKIPEGRAAISEAGGIPDLVNVLELGSMRAKENAAAALLLLCVNSSRFCNMVLQEGAVPPLVALSHSGTPRARAKAHCLLTYFRNQ